MKLKISSILIFTCLFSLEIHAQENQQVEGSAREFVRIVNVDSTRMRYYYWIDAYSKEIAPIVILSRKVDSDQLRGVTGCIEAGGEYHLRLNYVRGFSDLPGIIGDSASLDRFQLYQFDFYYVEYRKGKKKSIHVVDLPKDKKYYTSIDLMGVCLTGAD